MPCIVRQLHSCTSYWSDKEEPEPTMETVYTESSCSVCWWLWQVGSVLDELIITTAFLLCVKHGIFRKSATIHRTIDMSARLLVLGVCAIGGITNKVWCTASVMPLRTVTFLVLEHHRCSASTKLYFFVTDSFEFEVLEHAVIVAACGIFHYNVIVSQLLVDT